MNGLVMYDHQTDSLWSQVIGLGVKGQFEGVTLDITPGIQTTWEQWSDIHPDTLVLDKRGGYRFDTYAFSYYGSDSAGIIGRTNNDRRRQTKEFVVGLALDGRSKAYPFRELSATPVVNDEFAGSAIVVAFDPGSATGVVFNRTVADQTLTFSLPANAIDATHIEDEETGTLWNALTGEAVQGPLLGNTLRQIPTTNAFWFGWVDFHPDTQLYEAAS